MSEALGPGESSQGLRRSDEHLAASFGASVQDFVEVFGGGWRRLDDGFHDFDADPTGGEESWAGPWHVSGEPPQLMLRLVDDRSYELALVRGQWLGHRLVLRPHEEQFMRLEDWRTGPVAIVIEALLKRRRRSFRYCRCCRSLTPPEFLFDKDACMGCAVTYFGVVF
jgi:hypothetical protein